MQRETTNINCTHSFHFHLQNVIVLLLLVYMYVVFQSKYFRGSFVSRKNRSRTVSESKLEATSLTSSGQNNGIVVF
jgi:hypothetical protein